MKQVLLLLLLSLPAWSKGSTDYTLTFDTYPPEAGWVEQVAGKMTDSLPYTRVPLTLSKDDIEQNRPMEVRFKADHFKDQRLKIELRELNTMLENGPELVWPDQVVLAPNSGLEGVLYSLRYRWQATLAGLIVLVASVGFAWSRQRHSKTLQSHQARLQSLARQARHQGDALVANQAELGRYKIVDKLGEGGMAAVYKAVPTETLDEKEAVAIKVMRAELTNPEDRKRFIREINTVNELRHPNIVRLDSYGETPSGELYMAMELVNGRPLEVPEGGLPLAEVSRLLEPMVAGLSYAHAQGVVHRDFKPANVMVTSSGQVKVMDFGLARSHDASKVTRTGTVLGSPAYVSPEQLGGGALDARSDQYSLGASLYEMLSGRVPFPRSDTMSTLMAHMLDLASPLPKVPASIDRVVRRTLEKNPALRYPNLEAMLQAWQQALADPNAFSDWNASPPAAQVQQQQLNLSDEAGDETLC